MNKTINYAIRHGEVFLRPVEKVPAKDVAVQECTSFIVGHSETGHHHVLESKANFTVTEDAVDKAFLYVTLFEPGTLVHQKTVNRHNNLTVPAGTYEVIRKTEYNPFTKAREQVWD
jgi:hypothetical protein